MQGADQPVRHVRAFPDATFTDVVSPNADTLYSLAWLDLAKEPIVLSVPEMGKRYYLMELVEAWTNVFDAPGRGPPATGRGLRHRRAGLDWKAARGGQGTEVPDEHGLDHRPHADQRQGRLSGGPRPSGSVQVDPFKRLEQGLRAARRRAGRGGHRCEDAPRPAGDEDGRGDVLARLNTLMKDHPPAEADADAMKRFAAIGVAPGKPFDPANLDPASPRGSKVVAAPHARRSSPGPRSRREKSSTTGW